MSSNDLNLCQFIGRLGRDPEVRALGGGGSVTTFSIALGWRTKTAEGTEWVNLVAFNRLGEICAEFLRKGSRIYAAGKIRTRKWQAQDGSDRYTTEVVLDSMQMLDSKQAREGGHEARTALRDAGQGQDMVGNQDAPQRQTGAIDNESDFSDDIPF